MSRRRLSLIARVTLLVLGVEIVAFGLLCWLYFDYFSHYHEQRLRERFQQVGSMLNSDSLPASSVTREALMGDLLGAPVTDSVLVGGNGYVISSSDAGLLGSPAADLPRVAAFLDNQGDESLRLFFFDDEAVALMRFGDADSGAHHYVALVTLSMSRIRTEQRTLLAWGVIGAVLFIGLSSIAIGLVVRQFHRNELAMATVKERLERVLEGSEQGFWDWNVITGETQYSERWAEMLGYRLDEITPNISEWENLVHPEDLPRVTVTLKAHLEGHTPFYETEHRVRTRLGSWLWILDRGKVVEWTADGRPLRMAGTHSDISERMRVTARLRESEQKYRMLAENSPLPIQVFSADGRQLRANAAWQRMMRIAPDTTTGYSLFEDTQLKHNGVLGAMRPAFEGQTVHVAPYEYDVARLAAQPTARDRRWLRAFVYPVLGPDDAISEVVVIQEDVTAEMASKQQIHDLAYRDSLTQLPNRRLFLDRLEQALKAGQRSHAYSALIMLDLDHFKSLNDTHGHDAGDLLLIEVARRLQSHLRECDTVARLGGDEFVVLVEGLSRVEVQAAATAQKIAENIRLSLAATYEFGDGEIEHRSTPSIGITLFAGKRIPRDALLKQADLALYQAKDAGRNCIRFFNADMQRMIEDKQAMIAALGTAIERREFRLFYQPRADLRGRITGYEVVLRWLSPVLGMVSPDRFMPLAEETGSIADIGQWVIEQVCEQLARWQDDPQSDELEIAVDVSARHFQQDDFVEQVENALAGRRHVMRRLSLELTESTLQGNLDSARAKMLQLNRFGVRFALEGFGAGYASLSYLKDLPLHRLKVARSFMRDIETDPGDQAIVRAILATAHAFGLDVIADGIDTEAQKAFLETLGCEYLQGDLVGRPMLLAADSDFEAASGGVGRTAQQAR